MSDEPISEPVGATSAATEDGESKEQVISTEENILTLLRNAASLAEGNSRYAVEIAQRMSDQVWAAQKSVLELQARVKELEAEVQLYRDKSERAEAWLGKISSEIQERVLRSSN
jgi:cell division protein FtsB